MEMDAAMEEEEEFMGSNNKNHMMIIKRKRTKRLRKSSSSLSLVATCSSSSDVVDDDEIRNFLIPTDSISSEISSSFEEDEDMANCLILLAQSGCPRKVEKEEEEAKMEKNGSKLHCATSRRFNEMVGTTTGKVGIYVYECKTCNRSFPSFQALGGHRASHKKPKIAPSNDDQEQEKHEDEGKFTRIQLPKKEASTNAAKNKIKIHECSICGFEFLSGQALGGHMRRHRNIPAPNKALITMNIIDTSTTSTTTESSSDGGERLKVIRKLDLNLPAPSEDDAHDSKFQYLGNQQQQQHPFSSSPALVDCHY